MEIHYIARNIYQYAYFKTLYREVGGDFIIHKPRSWWNLTKSFYGFKSKHPSRSIFGTQPKTRSLNENRLDHLSGIIISSVSIDFTRNPKRLKSVRITHGIGNKLGSHADDGDPDYFFLDGDMQLEWYQNNLDLNIPEEKLVKIGNFRFDDYTNGLMDKEKINKDFGVKDPNRPSVTYAPTWAYGGGTFEQHVIKIIEELSGDYNLFLRPHYYDWRNMEHVRQYIRKHNLEHVYLVEPWNIRTKDTMENLFLSDLLITDNSSISYQSLIFQTPIILIDIPKEHLLERVDDFDLRKVVDIWDGKSSIKSLVDENFATNKYKSDLKRLLNSCFYFNDGQATTRAIKKMEAL